MRTQINLRLRTVPALKLSLRVNPEDDVVTFLKQRGIIEEYTTIINPQKISGAVSCYFELETQPDTLGRVTEILEQNETVTQVYRVRGKTSSMSMR